MKTGYLLAGILAGAFAYEFNRTADIQGAYAGFVTDLEATPSVQCQDVPDCQINDVSMLLENQEQEQLALTVTMIGQDLKEGDIVGVVYTQTGVGYALDTMGFDGDKDITAIEIIPVR